MTLAVCVAGATGRTGRPLAERILEADDLTLWSAVSRSAAGADLGTAWGGDPIGVPVHAFVADGLDGVDVLVDYTSPAVARRHALTAIERGIAVVVGTSGLGPDDLAEIAAAARSRGVGVVAAEDFSLTGALAQAAAALVAPFLPHREIIDYGYADRRDAPSGCARELAERLGAISTPPVTVPAVPAEARGAPIAGTRVHSVRLPSFLISTEVVFALPDERLVIRHDAVPSVAPYVSGTLLAVRAVPRLTGLIRGLDAVVLNRHDAG
jgi:4-hydroxy-tetrahydrodipicolinate reductase